MDIDTPIMTIADVATILQVSEKTITRMLQDGSIPGFKIANQWRFHPEDFHRWLLDKRRGKGGNARSGDKGTPLGEPAPSPLSRMTDEDLVLPGLPSGSKEETLARMAEPLLGRGVIADAGRFVEGLMDRERMMTTGIGGGLAIPHLRRPAEVPVERPLAVIGVSRDGIGWDSIDGRPVHLVILPVAGDETTHLKTLAAIRSTFVGEGMLDEIINATTAADLIGRLVKLETLRQYDR